MHRDMLSLQLTLILSHLTGDWSHDFYHDIAVIPNKLYKIISISCCNIYIHDFVFVLDFVQCRVFLIVSLFLIKGIFNM